MNINKHERKEKEIRKLKKRVREVDKMIRDQPLKELKEPFQKGWIIFYKLRDDIARRKDADKIWTKLSLAYRESKATKSLKHVKMVRQGIKGYYEIRDGKRVYITLGPDKKYFTEREYQAFDEHVKAWFYYDITESWYYGSKKYRVDIPDHWLVMKVRANMMTHVQEIDGDLESESEKIWQRLDVMDRSRWCRRHLDPRGKKRTEERIAIQKFMKGITEDVEMGKALPPHW